MCPHQRLLSMVASIPLSTFPHLTPPQHPRALRKGHQSRPGLHLRGHLGRRWHPLQARRMDAGGRRRRHHACPAKRERVGEGGGQRECRLRQHARRGLPCGCGPRHQRHREGVSVCVQGEYRLRGEIHAAHLGLSCSLVTGAHGGGANVEVLCKSSAPGKRHPPNSIPHTGFAHTFLRGGHQLGDAPPQPPCPHHALQLPVGLLG